MEKWELARYLIDAKKSVDTMLYLSLYAEKVTSLDKGTQPFVVCDG